MNKTELMKKLSLIILMVVITIASTAYAEENTGAETATASIGDVAFSLTNEQAYFDVLYKYPDEFELEIKEDGDRVRNIATMWKAMIQLPSASSSAGRAITNRRRHAWEILPLSTM